MSDESSVFYGPWMVEITDGDTLWGRHEIYALSEEDAIEKWRQDSDLSIDEYDEIDENDLVTVTAWRVNG